MEEEKKLRGRPATGVNTVDVHYKMASDLFNALPPTVKRNTYINDANSYLAANDPTTLFVNLQGNYEEGSLESLALDQGITKSFEVYDGETTTYKDVAEIVTDYNAYNHYLEVVSK